MYKAAFGFACTRNNVERPSALKINRLLLLGFVALAKSALLAAGPTPAATAVLTYHNDSARTGANTNESVLTLGNVNTNSFGLLSSRPVDDWVYAQPLVVTNVTVPGQGTHNLVIVATANDSIYAFDADDPQVTMPYWKASFLGPNVVPPRNTDNTGPGGAICSDYAGNFGIVGTPVIDPVTMTLYVNVRTKEYGSNFVQRLHALDVSSGAERPNSPALIEATYPGFGEDSTNGIITFNAKLHNQRPALTFVNGVVYIAWSSHCDWGSGRGWVMGFDGVTLSRLSAFVTTPNGVWGGIWGSGGGPAVDSSGNLYFATGNGPFDPASQNFSDSFLKLSTATGLSLVDYFTPYNQAFLEGADLDVGSTAPIVLPDAVGSIAHRHLLVGASKNGTIYLLDRDNLGRFLMTGDSQIVGSVPNAIGQCYSTPAFFDNRLFIAGSSDCLKAFKIAGGSINPVPLSQTRNTFPWPAPTPTISANGTNDAIAWVVEARGWVLGTPGVGNFPPALLHAYNASNLSQELYNSDQAGIRDNLVGGVKFAVPTVANGKVFVGGQYALSIFGNASFVSTPTISPNGLTYTNSITVTLSNSTPGASIYYTLDTSVPTTDSILYTGPFTITNSVAVKARGFKNGFQGSDTVSATFLNSAAVGSGTGLGGSYFPNQTGTFNGSPALVRTDPLINFNWGLGSPDPLISTDHFSVRWLGSIQPQFSETYTLYFKSDDGVRVWVNGVQVINRYFQQPPTEASGTIKLTAQQKYGIKVEYFEDTSGALATLSWSSPSTPKAIVPTSQLYPTPNQAPVVSLLSPTNGALFQASSGITFVASATDDAGVSKVDFYANSTNLLGTVSNTPYALTVTGMPAGTYSLRAVAVDGTGTSSTSAPVSITLRINSSAPYGLTSRSTASAFFNMPVTYNPSIPAKISQTGLFQDIPNLLPVAALLPYDVNVPLWSDGAQKSRWLVVPNNGPPYTPAEQVNFAPTGEWSFPAGSVFVKHFDLVTDETKPNLKRRLETRLLIMDLNGGAYGITYKWRPDNSDADLLTSGLNEDIIITNAVGIRTQTWYYPSPTECMICHTPAAKYVLGIKTRQLNGSFTYPSTLQTDNQLRSLNRLGLFYPALDESKVSGYSQLASLTNSNATLEDRARSYLDSNCAHCHRPGGVGLAFDLRYDTPLTNQNIVNAPLQQGNLGFDNARVVVPKDIWRSILYQRMNTCNPVTKMPPLGRNLIDTNAIEVQASWINSLPGIPALSPPIINPAGGSFAAPVAVSLSSADPGVTLRYTLDNTLPTTNSPVYSGPLVLSNTAVLTAKSFKIGFSDSVGVPALFSLQGFVAPVVSILSPANGSRFAVSDGVSILANASDPDGLIAKVDFLASTNILGTVTNSPYSLSVTGLVAGDYTLLAIATDGTGCTATSAPVTITLTNIALPVVATPSMAPPGGTFIGSVAVTLTDSTPGASIYYTLNNSTPTTNSLLYTSPITLSSSVTLSAKAFLSGYDDSGIAQGVFTIQTPVPPLVTLLSPTNGNTFGAVAGFPLLADASDPDGYVSKVDFIANGTNTVGTLSNSPYSLSVTSLMVGNYTLTAIATDGTGYTATSAPVTITLTNDAIVATPLINPSGGSFTNLVLVTLSDATPGAAIYYTLDNSVPTTASSLYIGPIILSSNATLTAKAFKFSYIDSFPASGSFVIQSFQPPVVNIIAPTNGVGFGLSSGFIIMANATDPDGQVSKVDFLANTNVLGTVSNSPYSLMVTGLVAGNYVLTAVATDGSGLAATSSPVTVIITNDLPLVVATPLITPSGGTYTNSLAVTLSDSTLGATIYYTLDNSIPTTNSLLYVGPFVITNSVTVSAKAFLSPSLASAMASAAFLNASAIGNGTGLVGSYYSNQLGTFNGSATLVRVDPTINFNWGLGAPDPTISTDRFSVRWTGSIQPRFSETYRLYVKTDDGVRLWINGSPTPLIDSWVQPAGTESSGSVALKAQQKYRIKIEYYESAANALAQFSWSSPSTPKAIVPASQLYAAPNLNPVASLTAPTNGAVFSASGGLTLLADVTNDDGPVTKVDFFANATNLLGTLTNSPYTLTLNSLRAGSYMLTAIATDGAGYTGTSAPVAITVTSSLALPTGLTSVGAPASSEVPLSRGLPFPDPIFSGAANGNIAGHDFESQPLVGAQTETMSSKIRLLRIERGIQGEVRLLFYWPFPENAVSVWHTTDLGLETWQALPDEWIKITNGTQVTVELPATMAWRTGFFKLEIIE